MMIEKEKLKAFLMELLDQANEVEADTGEIPTAQEAIGWIIDWIDQ
jgi:predicted transcriptional regulator